MLPHSYAGGHRPRKETESLSLLCPQQSVLLSSLLRRDKSPGRRPQNSSSCRRYMPAQSRQHPIRQPYTPLALFQNPSPPSDASSATPSVPRSITAAQPPLLHS